MLGDNVCYMLQELAALLYKAARDGSYVDPGKVQEILGIPPEETTSGGDRKGIQEISG